MAGYRQTLESLFGPMTDLAFAAQTFGLYSGFIYVTPLLGAWLGDRVLGKTRTVTMGALLMSAGHLAMASERLFLVALLLLILGAGCLIGNMAAQVGQLYAPDDERRTRAFAVYLIALNVGALISPLVCGTLGEIVGWHWGFGAAGVGMLIGLIIYLAGRRHLPPDRVSKRAERVKLTRSDWRCIGGILLTLLPFILTMTAFQQAYGLLLVWADHGVDHSFFGWEMPITWVLTFDGLVTVAGVMFATAIWKRAAARGREPDDILKLGIGCAGVAFGFLYLGAVATLPVVPTLLLLFYLILDLAIGWLEAPTASLTSRECAGSGERDHDGGFQACDGPGVFPARLVGALLRTTRARALLDAHSCPPRLRVPARAALSRTSLRAHQPSGRTRGNCSTLGRTADELTACKGWRTAGHQAVAIGD